MFSNKKYKKLLIIGLLLVFLVGCKSVIDPETRQVMDQYIIRLGDPFPWGKEGYGWFAIFIIWPIAQLFNLLLLNGSFLVINYRNHLD